MTLKLSVSVDGPTGSGKTTLGVELARRFGGAFLDTGLTFRALAYCMERGELDDDDSWRSFIAHTPMCFSGDGSTPGRLLETETVTYKGIDITEDIWGFDVDNRLDMVGSSARRRFEILHYHREIVSLHPRIVVAGRDVATTLLENATLQVYLTANFAVRRERRRAQHRAAPARSVIVGAATRRDLATLEQLRSRPNAAVIDTTYLPRAAVFDYIEKRLVGAIS